MKKFLSFVLVPVLSASLVLLKIPVIDEAIKSIDKNGSIYIGVIVALCTVLVHLFNVILPFKKFEKIEKNKWQMLELITTNYQSNFFKTNKFSCNVMTTKRIFINDYQPSKKDNTKRVYIFFQKIFKVIWVYGGKPYDKRLCLTVQQGGTGSSYESGKPVIIDFKTDGIDHLNLNSSQKEAIKHLEFMISCPIFAIDDRYGSSSGKIIGFLNVACSNREIRHLIASKEAREDLTELVLGFSKICSLIM